MAHPFGKRWLHPQTVPRGFLRFYIMTLLSKGPRSGYSMIQHIEERTDNAWRPGPGTMYPLLKSLEKEGIVRGKGVGTRGVSRVYTLTARGQRELERARGNLMGIGKKEPVIGRLFSDLMPANVFVEMVLNRWRDGSGTLREKILELPPDEREAALKEFKVIVESTSRWAEQQLSALAGSRRTGA